jgi:hypothetical protein
LDCLNRWAGEDGGSWLPLLLAVRFPGYIGESAGRLGTGETLCSLEKVPAVALSRAAVERWYSPGNREFGFDVLGEASNMTNRFV